MTALARILPLARVLRWLRGPRVADFPDPDLSWLDRADGRVCPECGSPECHALDALRAEGSRYDVQWPSVLAAEVDPSRMAAEDAALAAAGPHTGLPDLAWYGDLSPMQAKVNETWARLAAEAPGGDLAAMAAPLPGRSCLGCGYTPADPSECVVGACVPGYHELALIPAPGMARDELGTYAEPSEWTEPVPYVPSTFAAATFPGAMETIRITSRQSARAFDRITADLASLDRELDAFADGRAYESGSRCRTDSAALRRAGEHLTDGQDGARRAALVLAGFTGAEAWAV